VDRVDRQRAEAIAELLQGAAERDEIGAAVRGEQPHDVFERENFWRSSLGAQARDQRGQAEEGAGAGAIQPAARASERKILTGEGGPGEIGASRQIRRRQPVDVAEAEIVTAPVLLVGAGLGGIEIVREQTAPAGAEPRARHAAAGEEFVVARAAHAIRFRA